MKLKLLLLFLVVSCFSLNLFAKTLAVTDTIRNLVISEVRIDNMQYTYCEISNRSTTDAIDLSNVSFCNLTSWSAPWGADNDHQVRLNKVAKKILWPGESFVIVDIYDLPGKMSKIDPERWIGRQNTQLDMWTLGDMQIHVVETDFGNFPLLDSVSPQGKLVLESWDGRDVFFLRQHFSATDSIVIDEVNADFSRGSGFPPTTARNVAGVTGATGNSILYRKFSVKTGDLGGNGWPVARGVDMEDSQWLPVSVPRNGWGKEGIKVSSYWTVGNDGNFQLNPTLLQSTTIDINWIDTVMTVPWGTRSDYNIMKYFTKAKGIAWKYAYSTNREDSAFVSVRTGDKLTLYAVGNKLQTWPFKIVVSQPTAGANLVVPKIALNNAGYYNAKNSNQFNVTWDVPVMDTILDVGYATRADSLLKYLEKAPDAAWEIIPVDGLARPDLKNGDKLKVTAKNGAIKNYFIKVDAFIPSHTAIISAITWPDIPAFYKGLFGWTGDTIPSFNVGVYSYTVTIPSDVPGIPALQAKAQDLDTKIDITKVKNINGSPADKTITFKAIAEDDTTILTYKVQMEKELPPADVQPFAAEPFFSQYTNRPMWAGAALAIMNPGNVPLDLSNYLLVQGGNDGTPAAAITASSGATNFNSRYNKYIPGRTWATSDAQWQTAPYRAIQDLAVNPIVQGGGIFICAAMGTTYSNCRAYDVDFYKNPWGDTLLTSSRGGNIPLGWINHTMYMFKILNDSVRDGTKSVGDPNDFQLIEVFGNGDGTNFVVGGFAPDQLYKYLRRPQFWEGRPAYKGSFGTTTVASPKRYPPADDGEWDIFDRAYYGSHGWGWPRDCQANVIGLDSHTILPLTQYKSTVTSTTLKVSTGYSVNETIKGVLTGTTVDQFLAAIAKADPGQTLTMKSGTTVITGTTALKNNDVLEVKSKDGKNTSKYKLSVDANGLSKNATLTSTTYTVGVTAPTGTVSGYAYGTNLKTVVSGVTVPAGASMVVINDKGGYVPLKALNYDTTYVDVKVNDKTYFEVTAEDMVTKILYQLKPTALSTDAFVESNVYSVDQAAILIKFIPRGTAVRALTGNLIPSTGASFVIVDKLGNVRTAGNIAQDDKVVVTAADGVTKKVYYLAMLPTREANGETVNYEAYVTSTVYTVDQSAMVIKGIANSDVLRTAVLAALTPSAGATAVVVNASGVVSTKADIDGSDKVKVTAANGITVNYYTLTFLTSANDIANRNIQLYPNPTTGAVNISGIESGNHIRVFNAMGVNISSMVANSDKAVISLDNQPNGMYLIMVENANQLVGKFKLIKK